MDTGHARLVRVLIPAIGRETGVDQGSVLQIVAECGQHLVLGDGVVPGKLANLGFIRTDSF